MSVKRPWAALPLAVLVAILAHLVGFGSSHLPGNDHAAVLFGAVGLALAAFLAAAFLRPLRSAVRSSIATVGTDGKGVLMLAAVAALAFVALEVAEGRGLLGSTVLPFLALVPIAAVVGSLARRAESLAVRAGTFVAVSFRRARIGMGPLVLGRRARDGARQAHMLARHATRGRAPPRFA